MWKFLIAYALAWVWIEPFVHHLRPIIDAVARLISTLSGVWWP